ncbi:MAG: SipW-dependent-type signal peptide-containing protein, partial [Clostridia bacterium]|nr:SipW-dependent-type signal peptide-containing protein [Clostridia bacterium]
MKNTKKSLVLSVIGIVMCVAMLIGTTFAWFTDSVTTGTNTIQAGTLDIDLVDAEGNSLAGQQLEFAKAAGAPSDEQVLWEPGCTYTLPEV